MRMKFIVRVIFVTEVLVFFGVFAYKVVFKIPASASLKVVEQRLALRAAGITGTKQLLTNKYLESYRYHLGKTLRKLDFGYYFFANHPREIPGEVNKQIFLISLLPVMILGLGQIYGNWGYFLGCLILAGDLGRFSTGLILASWGVKRLWKRKFWLIAWFGLMMTELICAKF